MSSRKSTQAIADLLITGLAHAHCITAIPNDLQQLILLYILMDKFQIDISSNKSFDYHPLHGETHRFYTFGTVDIQKGDIKTFKFIVLNKVQNIDIGIVDSSQLLRKTAWYWGSGSYSLHIKHPIYALRGTGSPHCHRTFFNKDRNYKFDVITMTLDMTRNKYGILSYQINGVHFGFKAYYINLARKYRLCITMRKHCHIDSKIQLI